MTERECGVWQAVYAAGWIAEATRSPGGNDRDDERAGWCARQACRAVEALNRVATTDDRLWWTDAASEALKVVR